jgi:hypothetical protein
MSPAETLCRYFDLDDAQRWSFDLQNLVHVEGYAIEVEEDRVLFMYGGPLSSDEPEWIAFESIDVLTLAYWSKREGRWVDVIVPT